MTVGPTVGGALGGISGSILAAVVLAALAVGAAALLLRVVARLPEPEATPARELAEGEEPTTAERLRAEEPPKPLYADLAADARWRGWVLVTAGAAGALLGLALGLRWELLLVGPLAPVGAVLALVDARTRLLPSRLVWPVTLGALAYGLVAWPLLDAGTDLRAGLLGMALAWLVLGALWWFVPSGMGFGDVRMVGWLGFVLGHLGLGAYLVGLYAPFLLFGLPGLVLALVRRDRTMLKRAYPFGPFLILGAVLGVVVGALLAGVSPLT